MRECRSGTYSLMSQGSDAMVYPTTPSDEVPSDRRLNSSSIKQNDTNGHLPLVSFSMERDESGPLPRSPQHIRILVVDDDVWIRDVLARVLIRHHYQVNTAASAEEALELLRFYPYDMLVSDMMMTGMSGLELT